MKWLPARAKDLSARYFELVSLAGPCNQAEQEEPPVLIATGKERSLVVLQFRGRLPSRCSPKQVPTTSSPPVVAGPILSLSTKRICPAVHGFHSTRPSLLGKRSRRGENFFFAIFFPVLDFSQTAPSCETAVHNESHKHASVAKRRKEKERKGHTVESLGTFSGT